uniref:(northern house mosquito) hypothetical protein n=1 Tax=Culex pipiens TaxID=7175 RepID=A0A8D8GSM2_CULPI
MESLIPHGRTTATFGGTRRWRRPTRLATRSGWPPRIRCLCCTPVDQRASPRVCFTPPLGIFCTRPRPSRSCLTTSRTTFTGAPPILVGSPATRTCCTDRWPTVPPRLCSRVVHSSRRTIATGRLWTSTRSRSSTRHRRRSDR